MRRWPIRIRLTAAFTAVIALAPLAVGGSHRCPHERIARGRNHRIPVLSVANLRPIAADANPLLAGGNPDNSQQIIGPDGQAWR